MALSGTILGSTVGGGYRLEIDWSATQNTTNNTSTITANVYWHSLGSSYTVSSSATKTGSTTIGAGTSSWSVAGAGLSGNQRRLLNTYSYTVTHDGSGNYTGTISSTFNCAVTLGSYVASVSASASVTLNQIPRETTLSSSPSWTMGNPLAMSFSVQNGGYLVDVTISVNGVAIKTIAGIAGSSYTYTFTTAENQSILTELNKDAVNFDQATNIAVTTKSGGTQIGSTHNYAGTCSSPSATTVSASNFVIGASTTITLGAESNTNFAYDLVVTMGSWTKTLSTKVGYGNITWTTSTDASSMYGQIPNANAGLFGYNLTTYWINGSTYTKVRNSTSSGNLTASVDTVAQAPTFAPSGANAVTYADTNATVAGITGNNAYIVQNQSTLTVTLPVGGLATANASSSITRYDAIFNGTTVSNSTNLTVAQTFVFNASALNVSSNQSLVVKAVDSRGNNTSSTLTVNIVPYSPPVVVTTATRDDGFSTPSTIKLSGSVSSLNVAGTNKNSVVSMTYQYRVSGGTYNATTAFTAGTATFPSYLANNVTLTTQLINTSAWDVQVIVTDKLGSTTIVKTVAIGVPIYFIDSVKKSIGIGQFPSGNGTLELAGGLSVNGKPFVTELTGTIPATAGWYRIATSPNGIANVLGEFEILCAESSHHSYTKLIAGVSYGATSSITLTQLAHTNYGTTATSAITQARVVYDTTYSGNYAYLEVYWTNASTYPMTVRLTGGSGWSLIAPNTAGGIPTGYTSTAITLYSGGITGVNGLALQDNATNGIQFLNASGIMFDQYGNIKVRDTSAYSASGSWGITNASGVQQINVPMGSSGGQVAINGGRKAVSSANGEWRLEIVTMNVASSGGSATINGSVTFPTAFTTIPNVMYVMITTTVGYIDVMLEPFISSVTTTGFSCKFSVYDLNVNNNSHVFGSGTMVCNFLVFGK